MAKTSRNQSQCRKPLSSVQSRVRKRPRQPKPQQPRLSRDRRQCQSAKKQRSKITRNFLLKKHPELLADLELPVMDVQEAATKFVAFVELEKLEDELADVRLISDDARFFGEYKIAPSKKRIDNSQPANPNVVATVTLAVGEDANMDLVKEREGIVVTKSDKETKEEAENCPPASEAKPLTTGERNSAAPRRVTGFITKRDESLITIRVNCLAESLEVLKDLPLKLTFDINTAQQKSQLQAIYRVQRTLFIQQKLAYKITPPTDKSILQNQTTLTSSATAVNQATHTDLNEEQQRAVNEITRGDTSNIFMLFGPPGTGKTFTLVKAITQLVRSGKRVLICAPSNKAADVISCAILNSGIGDNPPYMLHRHVSRSLDPSSVNPQLRSHAGIDMCSNEAYYNADEVCDLDDYAIVVSTLGSTPGLRKAMDVSKLKFTHIIIDEAGQAAEMEVWLPLAFFANEFTRLIVAGDPMQLGPVASVHLLDDPAYGYKTSILTRLYENEAFRNDPQNMVQLTKNYRSHEAIVKVVSQIFYDNTLEFTRPPGHDSLHYWHRLPQRKFPVFFESILGRVHTDGSGSSSNESEAHAVIFYIQSLLRWHKTVKRPPPLKKSCRINNSDDNGDESSAPEVWLSDDDFESISPKRARFLDTILRDESSTASSSMARPGGVQQKKKTEHEGRKKTQNAKNQSAKTKKRHSAESSETPIDSLEHRKRKPKNIRNNLFENVGFSPPPDARIPGKPESRRPYVDTVEGTRFVPFNSQFVHFTQMPSRSQRE
uniref:AAA domain-containing protein n=1 Tax=Panagrellus redivivus TaxID=6233 RepID=A0A7E4V8J2_PANRE